MRIQIIDLERYGGPRGQRGIAFPDSFMFLFKGWGGAPPVVAPPEPTPPPAASTPTLLAPAAPPATASATEVTQAQIDAKRQAKSRQGINSTILAGADASANKTPLGGAAAGKNTLLGGG